MESEIESGFDLRWVEEKKGKNEPKLIANFK